MWPHDSDEYQFNEEVGERALRNKVIEVYARWNVEGIGMEAVRRWLKINGRGI
jgi:hypothetical protein